MPDTIARTRPASHATRVGNTIEISPQSITAVNDAITSSHEQARITRQEHRQVIQLVHIPQPLLRRILDPDLLLRVEGRHAVQRRIHVPRADGVDADIVASPLGRQGFGQVHDGRLGGVVARLFLRVVDDCAGHGRDEDHGAGVAHDDHSLRAGLRDEEGAGDVNVDLAAEHLG